MLWSVEDGLLVLHSSNCVSKGMASKSYYFFIELWDVLLWCGGSRLLTKRMVLLGVGRKHCTELIRKHAAMGHLQPGKLT